MADRTALTAAPAGVVGKDTGGTKSGKAATDDDSVARRTRG
ncbi:hypothetical protein [Couchioplanes caeruleus]|nr:hypothetical protein [Couchioplanes caeruleus]